jgi:hypothetical protein
MHRVRSALVPLAVAAAFAASVKTVSLAHQARGNARETAVPFTAGERLTYDVTWSAFVVAGTAVSTVEKRSDSSYYIVAEGRPVPLVQRLYNIYYKMDTLLDTVTLLPTRGSLYSEGSGGSRYAVTSFDRARRKALFELREETTLKTEFDVPPQIQDGLSALYVLRAMTFKAGDRITLPVADDGLVYSVHADARATESVRVPLGTFDAWKVDVSIVDAQGQPAATNAAVWMSNDARRLPLKLQAELPVGHFVLVLREAR